MIDSIGGRRGRGISLNVREDAHRVRRVRNFWAHESSDDPGPMTLDVARKKLQAYLHELPDEWG